MNVLQCGTLALIFLFMSMSPGCSSRGQGIGSRAPAFMLPDLEGNRWYLSDHEGSILLINFWSVYCSPCIAEMPVLEKLSEEFGARNVTVVGICIDNLDSKYLSSFVEGLHLTYRILSDQRSDIARRYKVSELPATHIIDEQGILQFRSSGFDNKTAPQYRETIEQLCSKNKP